MAPIGAAPPIAEEPAWAPAGETPGPGLSISWLIIDVRGPDPPAPGSVSACISPMPTLGPEPPSSGWLDNGEAPSKPICALSVPTLPPPTARPSPDVEPPPMPPNWLPMDASCCSG